MIVFRTEGGIQGLPCLLLGLGFQFMSLISSTGKFQDSRLQYLIV